MFIIHSIITYMQGNLAYLIDRISKDGWMEPQSPGPISNCDVIMCRCSIFVFIALINFKFRYKYIFII